MKTLKKSFLFILLVTVLLGSSVLVGCRNPFIEGIVPQAPVGDESDDTPSGDQSGTEQPGDTPSGEQSGNTPSNPDDSQGGNTENPNNPDVSNPVLNEYKFGATIVSDGVEFRVYSKNATKMLLEIYEKAYGEEHKSEHWMEKDDNDVWYVKVPEIGAGTLYGFRAWGPNWPYNEEWTRGNSNAGFISDYDAQGNRFNPNKLLFDPYAKEISHDKSHPEVLAMVTGGTGSDGSSNPAVIYSTGEVNKVDGKPSREFDTGKYAPKAVVIDDNTDFGTKPNIPQEKAIIYEAHARGITKHESSASLSSILAGIEGFENITLEAIPDNERGTYAGAAKLAPYLKALGVNTIELLPVHESDNDCNPDNASGGNYWAYMTYGYFAPDRRYSSDKSLGGPTREFKEMVKAFHDAGMEVYLDVVFNHSGEGGPWYEDKNNDAFNTVELTFMRGLDNSTYYSISSSNTEGDLGAYWNNTGCGNNLQCDNETVRKLVIDSLTYWIDEMGVDGYRFDLAPVIGREGKGSWKFNKNAKTINDIITLGIEKNVEMIAEAWDCNGDDSYQVGNFPTGWGEWNGRYRDALRGYVGTGNWKAQGDVGNYIFGDKANFADQGGPHKSVNFIVAHDGFTLADLCSYEGAGNAQNTKLEWPFGPSDGGNGDNNSLSFVDKTASEDLQKADKRRANRNYTAIQMMSRGVPMIVWGDEFNRTQNGNNNPYNIDSICGWSNYNMINTDSPHTVPTGSIGMAYHNNFGTFDNKANVNGNFKFMNYMLKLREKEPALNQTTYNAEDGGIVDYIYSSPSNYATGDVMIHIDGSAVSGGSDYIVMMNMTGNQVHFNVPAAASGKEWVRLVDTQSYFETDFNCWKESEAVLVSDSYGVTKWSVVILKEVDEGTAYVPPAPEGSGKKIYLNPNLWDAAEADEYYAAYFFGGESGDAWMKMTLDGTYYSCEVPSGNYSSVIFTRNSADTTGWGDDHVWNQTEDLTIPTDGKNCFKVTSWGDGKEGKSAGTWSTK